MTISSEFKSIFTKTWEIFISQCSPNSSLRYTDLSNLFQLTAAKHSDLGGMSYFEMQENNQAWVLSRMRLEMDHLPIWHQHVEVKTWIESLDGIRSVRNIEMLQNGKRIAGASSLWVVLNTVKKRPEAIAIDHSHLEKFPDLKATSKDYDRVDLHIETTKITNYIVKYSDLDIVKHVNNVKYLEWCLDYIPLDYLENNSIKAMDLNYLNELNYGDEISIEISKLENNTLYFYIKKNNKICFALKIEM